MELSSQTGSGIGTSSFSNGTMTMELSSLTSSGTGASSSPTRMCFTSGEHEVPEHACAMELPCALVICNNHNIPKSYNKYSHPRERERARANNLYVLEKKGRMKNIPKAKVQRGGGRGGRCCLNLQTEHGLEGC
jgi:hypothetical protein